LARRGVRREWARQQGQRSAHFEDLREQLRIAEMERDAARREGLATRADLEEQKKRVVELTRVSEQFERLQRKLAKSPPILFFNQPVLLVGPRNVGKTSLIGQWEAPWDYSPVTATLRHRVCEVPVKRLDDAADVFPVAGREHPVRARLVLGLRVHDFPGEMLAQREVLTQVREETQRLRSKSKKDLGVVIICLFDAEEAQKGIGLATSQYYNGELFSELFNLVVHGRVRLERLILVFNKCDLLRQALPSGQEEQALLDLCRQRFAQICIPLLRIVNPDRVFSVLTVLGRENLIVKTQGGPVVLGEAIRPLIEAFLGKAATMDLTAPRTAAAAADLGH
jgi:hypothetical protein